MDINTDPQEKTKNWLAPQVFPPVMFVAIIFLGLVLIIGLELLAHNRNAAPPVTIPPSPTPALPVTLTLYNWTSYMPQSILDDFAAQSGITVTYQSYETQEEAVAGLLTGKSYDVVVMGNNFIPQLIAADILAPIDYQNVPNFKNISPEFRDLAYDPQNQHSIPFNWGTTGLLVRQDLITRPVTCWSDLWDPALKSKIAIWNIPNANIAMALKSLNYPANTEDSHLLDQAQQRLLALKDQAVLIWPGDEASIIPPLAEGRIVAAYGWSYDAVLARQQNLSITYVLPCEGTFLWGENFVIPKSSPHQIQAEQFLNFLLRPDIGARLIAELAYATPNEPAQKLLAPEIRNDPLIFPAPNSLKNSDILLPAKPETLELHQQIWNNFLNYVPETP